MCVRYSLTDRGDGGHCTQRSPACVYTTAVRQKWPWFLVFVVLLLLLSFLAFSHKTWISTAGNPLSIPIGSVRSITSPHEQRRYHTANMQRALHATSPEPTHQLRNITQRKRKLISRGTTPTFPSTIQYRPLGRADHVFTRR